MKGLTILSAAYLLFATEAAFAAKATICHIPPDDPQNEHTISVSENAVSAHLAHGDCEGECPCVEPCGDGVCDDTTGETCETCEVDCGPCPAVCGDAFCDEPGGETCETCEADCGPCASPCGDAVCDDTTGETCETCEADCGVCPTT